MRVAGNRNYYDSEELQDIDIAKAAHSVHLNSLADKQYGDANFQLPLNTSANFPVVYPSSALTVAVINGNIVTITGAGSTATKASPGNANYET